MAERIPLAMPDLTDLEETYLLEAFHSGWISSNGSFIGRFEQMLASACGTSGAIGLCNGTAALHLAMAALDLHAGDEVIVPSLTFVATANCVRYMGAEPVFVDVDPNTCCMDPALIERSITTRTRGIIPVHLYGHPADMDAINKVAAAHGLWVVEDAAEALFARYKERPAGNLARIATFSFYGNKVITSGEGGAVTCDDPALTERMRLLRGQGMDPKRRYYFPITGYNFRMTNIEAAILCAQLERSPVMLARRREICAHYRTGLEKVPGIDFQPRADWAEVSPWLFSILIDEDIFGMSAERLMAQLDRAGIETRPLFIPLHTLPPFSKKSQQCRGILPVTELLAGRGISLPTYSRLSNSAVDRVVETIVGIRKHA